MYNFDEKIDRTDTGSSKWLRAPEAVRKSGELPLSIADMEFHCPPAVTKAIIEAAERGIYGYTMPDDAYFNSVHDFLLRRHGYDVKKDWMLNSRGIVSALGITVRALSRPGDSIVVMTPVYYPFFGAIEDNGRKLVKNQLILNDGKYSIDFEGFERICERSETKLFIMSSPHNPVGRVWTKDELTRIAHICKTNNVIVLADEIHCDIVMPGYKHTSFLSIPEGIENCVVCTAMSKTFNLAGLSCSDIFIPNDYIREKVADQFEVESSHGVAYFARAASIAAHTECDQWLDEMIQYVARNFDTMYDFIDTRLPELKIIRAEGTYLAWIDMRALGLTNEQQESMDVDEAHLALDEGYLFGMGGEGFSRWNLAVPRAEIIRALERFETAINNLQKKRGLK